MKIALASPTFPTSVNDGLHQLKQMAQEASAQGAKIICFPESFLPGYPYEEFEIEKRTPQQLEQALKEAQTVASENNLAIILPMDWYDNGKYLNVAQVISSTGEWMGYQGKVQLDPSEDNIWEAGTERRLFEVNGLKFGISICHEGFRYPETVRWAARKGAQIVFHPHAAGSNKSGTVPKEWGDKNSPYYEKAMMMRSIENSIYFASVNYAFNYPESASTVIAPDGSYVAHQPYTVPGVLVVDIDLDLATGFLAKRYKTALHKQPIQSL
ncbi:carbon-nitrogen hydrolase family protein [Mucilaginibacter auburnensis]|uniref:Putative amidohydrolase n=1 Tax=Mucilaginibacter auburnensis TaxID=1457233 RepID=A0A2H9VSS5_9SPHI|nr:carbon-nitrogen hydrolase family protein [Mucilaginibacter auburnensis]PJJ83870.1 putative amidohydrolase [Mucilaginibacter auburnensis]